MASALSATPGSVARPGFRHKVPGFGQPDREKAVFRAALCFCLTLTILWREFPQTRRTDRPRRSSPTFTRRTLILLSPTPCSMPAQHQKSNGLRRLQNNFLHCGRNWLGSTVGLSERLLSHGQRASRINHFTPPAALRFSLYLPGATQRQRLDRLLLCCYPIVVCGRFRGFLRCAKRY